MSVEHPNLILLKRLKPGDFSESLDVFSQDVVFHYYNPRLPELQGDYVGQKGIKEFFKKIAKESKGTFEVKPVSATPVGYELVVVHTVNTMTIDSLEKHPIKIDVVLVWRIVDRRVTEIWDIPSVYTEHASQI